MLVSASEPTSLTGDLRWTSKLTVAVVGAAALFLAPPASAAAAADFGSNLVVPPTQGSACADCGLWNEQLHPSNTQGSLTSPISGVLVGFSVRKAAPGPAGTRAVGLRVISPFGLLWRGLAASPSVTPSATPGIESFSVRVPIAAGDYIGLEFGGGSGQLKVFANGVFLSSMVIEAPPLPSSGSPESGSSQSGWQVLLQGRVETDADGDGFGDETQDRCPGSAGSVAGCLQKKKCKRAKRKRKRGKRSSAAKRKRCKKRRKRR